ncbi:jg17920 [Pararge aegeria aegeria]|uniref:Jg17920 protein n=1 Tax=Pararge aegeria aegeria TaxID=348720 RepID=A0A8S4RL63_9NEOP|nr:jg17920 [Pararge aegeria aegeria]
MAGIGHSSLLKFFVDIPKITMSEHETISTRIESQVPRVQKIRSATETTFSKPEWENTPEPNTYDEEPQQIYIKGDVDTLSEGKEEEDIVTNKVIDSKEDDNTPDVKYKDNFGLSDKKDHDVIILKSEENAVYSPVITVTKEESTLTKEDVKLQKVVVSEDISDESKIQNRTLSVPETCSSNEVNTKIRGEVLAVPITIDKHTYEKNDIKKTQGGDQNDTKKIQTKIPKLRLKQVVEKIKKEKQAVRKEKEPEPAQKLNVSIPRIKDIQNHPQQNLDSVQNNKTQKVESPKVDDEFDKIYEEIIENEAFNNVPSPEKISNPIKLESKFEEIIHNYDENNVEPISIEKTKSKIPLLKRKSEQEIEIPPPSNRKHSLKRANTEDFKGKIPVAIAKEKALKSNVENIINGSTTDETTAGMKPNANSKSNFELLSTVDTPTVQNENTSTFMETKELSKISPTENFVLKPDKNNNSNIKDTAKCKIPVAFNSKETMESKINSTVLNKHPTRVNAIEKISSKISTDKTDQTNDKKDEKPQSYNVVTHNVRSSTVFLQSEKHTKQDNRHLTEANVDNKMNTEHTGSSLTIKNSNDVKHHTQNVIFDEPIVSKAEVLSLENPANYKTNQFYITSCNDSKSVNGSRLSENKHGLNASDIKNNNTTIQSPIKTVDSSGSSRKYHNKNADTILLPIEKENWKNNETSNIIENSNPIIVSNESIITTTGESKEIDTVVHNKVSENIHNVPEKLQKNGILEDPPAINTNIEEKEEEDIIMLKGKVDRVIRRLDSKDYKTVKKEIDDVPKGVSVISKIAIFDKGDSDTSSKTDVLDIKIIKATNQGIIVNDKPIIVNEILKTDANQNEINDKVETIGLVSTYVKVREENKTETTNNAHDMEFKEVNKTANRGVLKTKNLYKNSINEGNKIRRTVSSAVSENNEVFAKKDDEAACLEIWKEYRRKKELDSDIRRAKSLAELDLGDAVRGRVRQLVVRMSSVELAPATRARLYGKDSPVAGSVSQRIALYERKLTPCRGDDHPSRQASKPHAAEAKSLSEEELRRKIEELRSAKEKYGELDNMTYVELSDGGKMPVLALGTAMLEPALIAPVVSAALDLGYRAVDAAYVYGNEREVGSALRDKMRDGTVTRSELFIINKLWSTFHRRDLVEKACRQSLDAMGLDYFDLYLIHNPMSFKEGPNPLPKIANVLQYSEHDYLEAWYGIEGLVKKGLVKRGGLSNFNSVQIERVMDKGWIKPVVNQVECHPYLTQLRLEEFCLARNIKLSCFGVLGSKGTPPELTSGLPPVIDDPLVKVMAAGLGITPAQLLIRMGDTHRNYPFRIAF